MVGLVAPAAERRHDVVPDELVDEPMLDRLVI
jgi:hypothetical protein